MTTTIDWNQYADQAKELCDAAAMEVLDLQRFYTLAKTAVASFPTDGEETIPLQLSDVKNGLTIHPGDEEELISKFTEGLLPKYSIILMVSCVASPTFGQKAPRNMRDFALLGTASGGSKANEQERTSTVYGRAEIGDFASSGAAWGDGQ